MSRLSSADASSDVNVAIGCWAAVLAPTRVRTLLGSCVATILIDQACQQGGMSHIVLPKAPKANGNDLGRYADTAIPALLADLARLSRGKFDRSRLVAKLVGGAQMFRSGAGFDIGRLNCEAAERMLNQEGIPILARDIGGSSGRHVTLETETGVVWVRVPGGPTYEL